MDLHRPNFLAQPASSTPASEALSLACDLLLRGRMPLRTREATEEWSMKTIEVVIGDRITLEILPDELEPASEADDEPAGTRVTIVDLVPDIYER
ncbi:MAG: hypothetical protein HY816_23355 [Candidatus Wallbacteria bacterium]|nr:hypothetical protein [Candidatus Wallbacteria bacterium]